MSLPQARRRCALERHWCCVFWVVREDTFTPMPIGRCAIPYITTSQAISWPFKYATPSGFLVLRAPVGMYMLPAVLSKLAGAGSEGVTLLLQNTLLLGGIFSLLVALFTKNKRLYALLGFIFFSGMEIVGYWLRTSLSNQKWHPDHIEGWSYFLSILICHHNHILDAPSRIVWN